jgi:hypothetical protein
MKRLIALSLLLPALASAAQCPPGPCQLTSGSLVAQGDLGAGSFSFAGPGALISGSTCFGFPCPGGNGPIDGNLQLAVGDHPRMGFSDGTSESLNMDASTGGQSWAYDASRVDAGGATIEADVLQTPPITGAGTFSAPFTLFAGVQGWPEPSSGPPGPNCSGPPTCSAAIFEGAGRVTYDVVPNPPNPNLPGTFFSISKATYTLVPEPSTAALLLIGLAGIAVMGRRRRSDATLLASG